MATARVTTKARHCSICKVDTLAVSHKAGWKCVATTEPFNVWRREVQYALEGIEEVTRTKKPTGGLKDRLDGAAEMLRQALVFGGIRIG